MGTLWYDTSFDRLRNLSANLKCVVFVTTSPGLPYFYKAPTLFIYTQIDELRKTHTNESLIKIKNKQRTPDDLGLKFKKFALILFTKGD